MLNLRPRSAFLSIGLLTMLAGGIVVACTGNDPSNTTTSPDASTTGDPDTSTPTPPADDSGTTEQDSSTQEDAGQSDAETPDAETDAGDDGGVDDDGGANDDAGADGGGPAECNTVTPGTNIVASTCAQSVPAAAGGTFIAGTYSLKDVTTVESLGCSKLYISSKYEGTMVLTVTNGVATANVAITNLTTKSTTRYTRTYDPSGATAGSPAKTARACPAGSGFQSPYTSTGSVKTGVTLTLSEPAVIKGGSSMTYTWYRAGLIVLP